MMKHMNEFAAKKIGMPTSTFYKKLAANSFSVEETEKIFSSIGVKMVLASVMSRQHQVLGSREEHTED